MDEGLGELCLARGGVIFPSLTLSASRKLDTFHKKCLEAFISHVKGGFDEFSLKIDEFFLMRLNFWSSHTTKLDKR